MICLIILITLILTTPKSYLSFNPQNPVQDKNHGSDNHQASQNQENHINPKNHSSDNPPLSESGF